MSDVDRRGPVDIRLVRLIPGLRRHLVVVGAVAVVTAVIVVLQAEVLANGLADLVQNGDVSGGLTRTLVALAAVAAVRARRSGQRMVIGPRDAVDPPRRASCRARSCPSRR